MDKMLSVRLQAIFGGLISTLGRFGMKEAGHKYGCLTSASLVPSVRGNSLSFLDVILGSFVGLQAPPPHLPLFHRTHRWTIQHCFACPVRCSRLSCGPAVVLVLDQTHWYGKLSPNGGRSVLRVLSALILAVLVSQPLSAANTLPVMASTRCPLQSWDVLRGSS